MIKTKRVYDPPSAEDGERFLVDRLWPRGKKKEEIQIKNWLKDVAPSNELRNWFHSQPDQWEDFRRRYIEELDQKPQAWEPILLASRKQDVTLLYSSKNLEHNNAQVLAEYLSGKQL